MKNPIYPKIDSNIPSYIKEEYPSLHNLVISYFKWLETDKNFLSLLINFSDNIEVNNQVKPYIDIIKQELGWSFNTKLTIDDKTLIKLLRDFYLSRGSELSFKALFKILFNADVTLSYPRDDLFILSDNNYIIEHEIFTTATSYTQYRENFDKLFNTDILNITIRGIESNLTLIVDKITPTIINDIVYLKIIVNNTNNDFKPFETVEIYSKETGIFLEKIFSKVEFKIIDSGYAYNINDELTVEFPNNISAKNIIYGDIIVESILSGKIDKVGIKETIDEFGVKTVHDGLYYTTGDKVLLNNSENGVEFSGKIITTNSKQAEINLSVFDGRLSNITITDPGLSYITAPNITIVDKRIPPKAYGANFMCDEIVRDHVGDVYILSAGANYTLPIVTFSAPASGVTATGTAVVESGRIIGINITNKGSGYSLLNPPTITISQVAPGYTEARVFPVLMGSVTNSHIIKIDGGILYDANETEILFDIPDSKQTWAKTPDFTVEILDGNIIPTLIDGGYGYTTVPDFTILGDDNNKGFSIELGLNDSQVVIENFQYGSNYLIDEISITVDEPSDNGKINYIEIENPGSGFNTLDGVELKIIPNNIAATGGELYPISKSIGKIKTLRELSDFWFFNETDEIPIITSRFETNNTATISVQINKCINKNIRHNENLNGFLEFNSYLHDSYYYQQFSYVTNSSFPTRYAENIIKPLLHPVGFLNFGKFVYEDSIELDLLFDTYTQINNEILISPVAEFIPTLFINSLFEIQFPGVDNNAIHFATNNPILFNINNLDQWLFYNNYITMNIAYFENYELSWFNTDQMNNISDMAALDPELTALGAGGGFIGDLQAIQRIPGLAGYWSADPAYLFEDSSGTIPANTNGTGVVGLWTDVSQSVVLGTEVTTNGAMESGIPTNTYNGLTSLALSADYAQSGTQSLKAVCNSTAGYHYVSFNGITVGKAYLVDLWVYVPTNDITSIFLSQAGSVNQGISVTTRDAWVNIKAVIVAAYSSVGITAVSNSANSPAFYVDSVSIKEQSSKYAYQTTTTKKPILKRTPTSNVYWLSSDADDALTATLGNLGSACTVARAGAEGVTFTEGVTISSTYNIAPAYGFNGDVAIFNRALTTTEKDLLTRYMQRGVPLLGANLVTNGTFDTDITGWTNPAPTRGTISWNSGQLKIDGTAGDGSAPTGKTWSAETAVGTSYLIRCAFSTPDGSIGYVALGGVVVYGTHLLTNGQYSATLHKTTGDNSFSVYGSGLKVSYFDNVAVRAIL